MTIEEFVARAPAVILAFQDAYTRRAQTDPSFYPERTEWSWWSEVRAYCKYSEVEEIAARQGIKL